MRICSIHHLDAYSIAAWSEPPPSLATLKGQFERLLDRHPLGRPLVVILSTRSFKLSQRLLRRVADVCHHYGNCFGNRIALVTYRSMEFGAGVFLGALLEKYDIDLRPFLTLEDADAWLRQPASVRRGPIHRASPRPARRIRSRSSGRTTVPSAS